jgi:hypothetical protein
MVIDSDPAISSFQIAALVDQIATLQDRVDDFVALEESDAGPTELYHRVLATVHQLCATIVACEEAGFTREQIVRVLEPVRRILARSDFVRGLHDVRPRPRRRPVRLPSRQTGVLPHPAVRRVAQRRRHVLLHHIERGNPYRPLIEYFGDWFLIERTEEDIFQLCAAAGVRSNKIEITREQTGLTLLVEIRR